MTKADLRASLVSATMACIHVFVAGQVKPCTPVLCSSTVSLVISVSKCNSPSAGCTPAFWQSLRLALLIKLISYWQVYKQALESEGCQAVHLTAIDEDFDCDTYLEGFDQVSISFSQGGLAKGQAELAAFLCEKFSCLLHIQGIVMREKEAAAACSRLRFRLPFLAGCCAGQTQLPTSTKPTNCTYPHNKVNRSSAAARFGLLLCTADHSATQPHVLHLA